MLVLILVSSLLLVSELPMFALKFKHWNWKGNEIKYVFAALTLLILCIFGLLRGWWIVITLYFLISIADDLRARRLGDKPSKS